MKHQVRFASKGAVNGGFTLLELMTCIVIILILASLLTPSLSRLREKARAAQCASNLKSLFVAANSSIQDNQHWPQVKGMNIGSEEFSLAWLKELQPYGISKKNWLCPTIKDELHYTDTGPFHVDYVPTPFDAKPITPFLWPTHPWFSERGSVHGDGNLIILTNGSVRSLNELIGSSQSGP